VSSEAANRLQAESLAQSRAEAKAARSARLRKAFSVKRIAIVAAALVVVAGSGIGIKIWLDVSAETSQKADKAAAAQAIDASWKENLPAWKASLKDCESQTASIANQGKLASVTFDDAKHAVVVKAANNAAEDDVPIETQAVPECFIASLVGYGFGAHYSEELAAGFTYESWVSNDGELFGTYTFQQTAPWAKPTVGEPEKSVIAALDSCNVTTGYALFPNGYSGKYLAFYGDKKDSENKNLVVTSPELANCVASKLGVAKDDLLGSLKGDTVLFIPYGG
jgi:hypothetical protein